MSLAPFARTETVSRDAETTNNVRRTNRATIECAKTRVNSRTLVVSPFSKTATRTRSHDSPDKQKYNCDLFDLPGANANCLTNSHRPVCSCKPGFVGDPHVACRAIKDDEKYCDSDKECGYRLICENHGCIIGCRNSEGCAFGESCKYLIVRMIL